MERQIMNTLVVVQARALDDGLEALLQRVLDSWLKARTGGGSREEAPLPPWEGGGRRRAGGHEGEDDDDDAAPCALGEVDVVNAGAGGDDAAKGRNGVEEGPVHTDQAAADDECGARWVGPRGCRNEEGGER